MLNPIRFINQLEQQGFTKEQALSSVNIWIELMNENLATKQDIMELKSDIKEVIHKMDFAFSNARHEIKETESRLNGMESRITIKLGGIVGACIAIALGLTALIQK